MNDIRTAIGAIAVGAAALLAVGCSGAPASSTGSPGTGKSADFQKGVAYSQCMRTHGVPNFPDTGSNGAIAIQGSGDQGSGPMQSAQSACRHLLPTGGQSTAGQHQQRTDKALAFSRCMRGHGVPNYPDPVVTGSSVGTDLSGVDVNSPAFQSAERTCQSQVPGAVPPGAGPGTGGSGSGSKP
jgi:hypothetical protein